MYVRRSDAVIAWWGGKSASGLGLPGFPASAATTSGCLGNARSPGPRMMDSGAGIGGFGADCAKGTSSERGGSSDWLSVGGGCSGAGGNPAPRASRTLRPVASCSSAAIRMRSAAAASAGPIGAAGASGRWAATNAPPCDKGVVSGVGAGAWTGGPWNTASPPANEGGAGELTPRLAQCSPCRSRASACWY